MTTAHDWITLILFSILLVIFLQRSTGPAVRGDHILLYAPPAIGCAVANYLGNHDNEVLALLLEFAVVTYVIVALKPYRRPH